MHRLEIRDLKIKFKSNFELNIPQLVLEVGNVYLVTGSNGSGKTTFLRYLIGDFKDCLNATNVNGQKIHHYFEYISMIGVVFPNSLEDLGELTVAQCVELYSIYRNSEKIFEEELTHYWGGITEDSNGIFYDKKVKELSTGFRQRLSIYLALYMNPRMLVIDESLANLDAEAKKNVIALLEKIKDRLIIVAVTQNIADWEECIHYNTITVKDGYVEG